MPASSSTSSLGSLVVEQVPQGVRDPQKMPSQIRSFKENPIASNLVGWSTWSRVPNGLNQTPTDYQLLRDEKEMKQ